MPSREFPCVDFSKYKKTVSRPYSPLKMSGILEGVSNYLSEYIEDVVNNNFIVISENLEGTVYVHREEIKVLIEAIRKYSQDVEWCKQLIRYVMHVII